MTYTTPTQITSIIGRNALITVGGCKGIPAKVDTGADSSSIWATDIREERGSLYFKLFCDAISFYTGDEIIVEAGTFELVRIASSTGDRQERYAVSLPVTVDGKHMEVRFTLADRSTMAYPVLLGRSFLEGQFLVDVSREIPAEIEESLVTQKYARTQHISLHEGNKE